MEQVRKRSRKRDAILNCIKNTTVHPTAEWVFEQVRPDFPDLSLGTVYRNLTMFRESGEICSVGVIDGLEHFDGNTTPHAHLVCSRCCRVLDLPEVPLPEKTLLQAAESGCRITGWSLRFDGICPDCL